MWLFYILKNRFLCGCYMYNYWGAEQTGVCVRRNDQSAQTANY